MDIKQQNHRHQGLIQGQRFLPNTHRMLKIAMNLCNIQDRKKKIKITCSYAQEPSASSAMLVMLTKYARREFLLAKHRNLHLNQASELLVIRYQRRA